MGYRDRNPFLLSSSHAQHSIAEGGDSFRSSGCIVIDMSTCKMTMHKTTLSHDMYN